MERRSIRGPGLNGEEELDGVGATRPDLDRLLAELEVAVQVRHAVSRIVTGPASAIQAAALGDAVHGRDLLAVAPTGSGKTLVFAVGLVHLISGSPSTPGHPRAIVVSPTRELALQTDEVIGVVGAGAGLRTAGFVGGQPLGRDKRSLVAPVDIAVGTPGRLMDLMASGVLGSADIRIVVLDEVDQLLAPSFRDQTAALLDRCADATLVAATATADADVETELRRRRPDLRIHRVSTDPHGAGSGGPEGRPGTPAPTGAHTADDANNPRRLIVLTTTDLAGRGLDLENIGHIIHVGPPHSTPDLVHRSGRTGRAGSAAGTVAAVVRPADAARMVEQARNAGMAVEQINADAATSGSRLDELFGPEIAVPRQRRQPAPRDTTRRPARSRVHRPKKKRRT